MLAHVLFIICICFVSLSALAQDIAAKVIKSHGAVTAINPETGIRAIQRGSDVFANESVHTGQDAYLTLRFTDGAVFELAASSTVRISDYKYAKNEPASDKFSTELIEGGLRAITGSIGSRSPDTFKTKVRLTTLTVRGTGLAAGVEGNRLNACTGPACDFLSPVDNPNDLVELAVILGEILVNYRNEEYPLIAGSDQQAIRVRKGELSISPDVPHFGRLGFVFPSGMNEFIEEVQRLPPQSGEGDAPPSVRSSGGGAGSPPAGSDPCAVCDAVKSALDTAPASSSPIN